MHMCTACGHKARKIETKKINKNVNLESTNVKKKGSEDIIPGQFFLKKIAEEVAISNVALTFGENAFPLKLAIVSHTMGAFWCTY